MLGDWATQHGKKPGREVALKVQYPGVGDSIDNDVKNLLSMLRLSGMLPKGMYLDRTLKVLSEVSSSSFTVINTTPNSNYYYSILHFRN